MIADHNPEQDYLSLIEEANILNSRIFSLIRLILLSSLASFKEDGVTFRELKSSLNSSEGTLYANLKILVEMGYVTSEKVNIEGKKLEMFKITPDGLTEWERTKDWLCKFVECIGDRRWVT